MLRKKIGSTIALLVIILLFLIIELSALPQDILQGNIYPDLIFFLICLPLALAMGPTREIDISKNDLKISFLHVFRKVVAMDDILKIEVKAFHSMNGATIGFGDLLITTKSRPKRSFRLSFPFISGVSVLTFTWPEVKQILEVLIQHNPFIALDSNSEKLLNMKFHVSNLKTPLFQKIGLTGMLVSMGLFFGSFYFMPFVNTHPIFSLIYPLTISLAMGFIAYTITGKARYLILTFVVISGIFLYIGFGPLYKQVNQSSHISAPAPSLISFTCEDGTNFKVRTLNTEQIEVLKAKNISQIYDLESTSSDKVMVYGNNSYGYTFVNGYNGQVIFTDRSEPTSTICQEN